jgi:hypothetical protein
MSDLARALLKEIAADPVALQQLHELVRYRDDAVSSVPAPAYTVATLAAELGRTERSIRLLACYCPLDQSCHGDVLARMANGDDIA